MTPTSQFLVSYGELVVFLIVFVEQNGVPFPAAPFLLASGALAADGYINLFAAILCTTVGSVAADSIWFYTGHRTKTRLFRLFPSWHGIQSAVAQRTQRDLILRGIQALTAAKFLGCDPEGPGSTFRLAFSCAINLGMMFQYNFGPTTFASDRVFEELRNARVPIRSL